MDIGFYISELLEQHGEISVPGLGYLVRKYIPGQYNELEGKFYPPHHQIQFDLYELDGDDTLVKYIELKKNISLASAKYFAEKYINTIREDALVKDIAIDGIGWFYTENGKLAFKPANRIANDPAFFGYSPVNIANTELIPVVPVIETHVNDFVFKSEADKIVEKPVEEPVKQPLIIIEPQEEVYEEPKPSYGWLILITIIVIAALSVLGIYEFYPAQYNSALAWTKNITGINSSKLEVKKTETKAIVPEVDSTATDTTQPIKSNPVENSSKTIAKDSVSQTLPATIDPNKPWAVIAMSCHVAATADAAIRNFKAKGMDAFIVPNIGSSKNINIAVGAYATNAEADAAREKFIASKLISRDAYLTHIKTTK